MPFLWNIHQWAKQTKMFIEWRNLSSDKEESLYMKLLTCSEGHFESVQSVLRVSLNSSQIAANLCPICWEGSRKRVMTAHDRAFKRGLKESQNSFQRQSHVMMWVYRKPQKLSNTPCRRPHLLLGQKIKNQVHICSLSFLTLVELCIMNFFTQWQALNHITTSTLYGICRKMCKKYDLKWEFRWLVSSLLQHTYSTLSMCTFLAKIKVIIVSTC